MGSRENYLVFQSVTLKIVLYNILVLLWYKYHTLVDMRKKNTFSYSSLKLKSEMRVTAWLPSGGGALYLVYKWWFFLWVCVGRREE